MTKFFLRASPRSKSNVPITSTWSFGFTIDETLAAPVQLIDTARIVRLMSAESPVAVGLPPSMSAQKRTSPALWPRSVLRPSTSPRLSSSSACPRMPIAGTVLRPRSLFASTVPDGTSFLKHRTSSVPYLLLIAFLRSRTSASFADR